MFGRDIRDLSNGLARMLLICLIFELGPFLIIPADHEMWTLAVTSKKLRGLICRVFHNSM